MILKCHRFYKKRVIVIDLFLFQYGCYVAYTFCALTEDGTYYTPEKNDSSYRYGAFFPNCDAKNKTGKVW